MENLLKKENNQYTTLNYILNGEPYAVKVARTVRGEVFASDGGYRLYFLDIQKFIY